MENTNIIEKQSGEMEDSEEMVYDKSAYEFFKKMSLAYSCLSFDMYPSSFHSEEEPRICFITGSQAEETLQNYLMMVVTDDLDDEDDEENENDDNFFSAENVRTFSIPTSGTVNRIKLAPLKNHCLVANMCGSGCVNIWNLTSKMLELEKSLSKNIKNRSKEIRSVIPEFKSKTAHQSEGFALDWCPLKEGRFATGDTLGRLCIWENENEGSDWKCERSIDSAHKNGSLDDICWSPTENFIIATCGSDKYLRIWDTRESKRSVLKIKAHFSDVNTISWNREISNLIASGGDDGVINIWDMRLLVTSNSPQSKPLTHFQNHTGPITSIQWHPDEKSIFAASGEDDKITLWDMTAEEIDVEPSQENHDDIPSQLMFVHMGQKEIKEVKWHPQIEGMLISTSLDSFNFFKTISV